MTFLTLAFANNWRRMAEESGLTTEMPRDRERDMWALRIIGADGRIITEVGVVITVSEMFARMA